MSLKNTHSASNIAKLIQQKISHSSKTGIKISLIWIPGHSNIEGDVKADQQAKKAVEFTNTSKLNVTTFDDIKNQIKELIQIKWQTHWFKQNTKLKKIKNSGFGGPNSHTDEKKQH